MQRIMLHTILGVSLCIGGTTAVFGQAANTEAAKPDFSTPKRQFYLAAHDAAFSCELESQSLRDAKDYGTPTGKASSDLMTCISTHDADMLGKLKEVNSKEPESLKTSAKAVYSAWSAYSQALLPGMSGRQAKSTPAGVGFTRAMSDYMTEIKLSEP